MKPLSPDSPSVLCRVVVGLEMVSRLNEFAPAGNVSHFVRAMIETKLAKLEAPHRAKEGQSSV